ncbi:MAG: hypothetical protein O3B47_00200 [bacterium]|nr:hypothetical protein [bacterium]
MIRKNETFLMREGKFLLLMGLFVVACAIFYNQAVIAMWIGFALAGYSAISNDSIQTLGTFISSNKKTKWWILWLFIGGILSAVMLYGWYSNSGDVAFGRLERIPEPNEFHLLQLLAPVVLLILTRFKMPVSTTFLLLAVFSNSKTIGAMLEKTFIGYFVAFVSALLIWAVVGELMNKKIFFKEKYNESGWRVFQWIATSYLWITWLMQDLANVAVFLPRALSLNQVLVMVVFLFFGMGLLLFLRGGRIQEIITEKTDVVDVRAATIIDLVFGTILLVFKTWNNLPMSTTWVFLGLLAGREVSLARFTGHDKPYTRTLGLVMKDLAFASIGLLVSLLMAWLTRGDFDFSLLMEIDMFN